MSWDTWLPIRGMSHTAYKPITDIGGTTKAVLRCIIGYVPSGNKQWRLEIKTGQGETIADRWTSPYNGQAGGAVDEPLSSQSNQWRPLARCAELPWQLSRWSGRFRENRGLKQLQTEFMMDCFYKERDPRKRGQNTRLSLQFGAKWHITGIARWVWLFADW